MISTKLADITLKHNIIMMKNTKKIYSKVLERFRYLDKMISKIEILKLPQKLRFTNMKRAILFPPRGECHSNI